MYLVNVTVSKTRIYVIYNLMGQIVIYLLMVKKLLILKQKILKLQQIHYVQEGEGGEVLCRAFTYRNLVCKFAKFLFTESVKRKTASPTKLLIKCNLGRNNSISDTLKTFFFLLSSNIFLDYDFDQVILSILNLHVLAK